MRRPEVWVLLLASGAALFWALSPTGDDGGWEAGPVSGEVAAGKVVEIAGTEAFFERPESEEARGYLGRWMRWR